MRHHRRSKHWLTYLKRSVPVDSGLVRFVKTEVSLCGLGVAVSSSESGSSDLTSESGPGLTNSLRDLSFKGVGRPETICDEITALP